MCARMFNTCTDEISSSFNENCGLFTSKLYTYNHRRLKEILTTLAYQLIIFWPLIPQTLGHFTPYYIKTSDQTEISSSENSRQPKKHTASQKVGSDNFSREGGYDWDRWQLGSAKTDLDSNSLWFISVLSPPSQATGPSHCSPLSYHQF